MMQVLIIRHFKTKAIAQTFKPRGLVLVSILGEAIAKGIVFNVKYEDSCHSLALGVGKTCITEALPKLMELLSLPYPSIGADMICNVVEFRVS